MTTYPGGKSGSGVYQTIINQMPPHSVYIEPFLGGGAVMKYKKPARLANIAIDADEQAIHKFNNTIDVPAFTSIIGDAFVCLADLDKWLPDLADCYPEDMLIYCDPPYLMSTRSSQRQIYRYELSDDDHVMLLEILNNLSDRGIQIILSGYPSDLYDQQLRGWRRVSFYAMTRGGSMAEEVLWMNYPEPWELHDYRYLGRNFRERERIKRKIKRWQDKLSRMDATERAALMQAIQETRFSLSAATPEPAMEPIADLKHR